MSKRSVRKGVNNVILRVFNGLGDGAEKLLGEGAPVVLSFIGKIFNALFIIIGAAIAWVWRKAYDFVELICQSYHACFGMGRYHLKSRRLGSVIAGITSIAAFVGTIVFRGFSFTCIQYIHYSSKTQDANEYSYWVRNWDAYNKAWAEKNAFIANNKIASFLSSLNDSVGEKILQRFLILLGAVAFVALIVLFIYCFYKAFYWNNVIAQRKAEAAERKRKQKELEAKKKRARFNMVNDVINLNDYRAVR